MAQFGVLVEINCESDFVARSRTLQVLVADAALHNTATKPVRLEEVTEAERANFKSPALYEQKFMKDSASTVGGNRETKIAKPRLYKHHRLSLSDFRSAGRPEL